MSNIAIEVKDLKIRYRSLNAVSVRRFIKSVKNGRSSVHEALKGVSFTVNKGEIVGIIGENGCGKSTLLRAVAGIYSPDEGSINTFGSSVSLMAIGVGFQKQLTGRTNIMLSGLLLGHTEQYIKSRMKQIISFSTLSEFIDKPVSTYSSGMYSKLAFAITAILETEIMLIDEIFSVGDARFRKKSRRKMRQLIADENRTVLMVSHSMSTIKNMCDKAIWIKDGVVHMYDKTDTVLAAYEEYMENDQ